MKIAVTGSTGLIGSALVAALRSDGHQVLRLIRRAPVEPDEITWDPRASGGGLDPSALEGVDAVIHLAGAGVGDHRWSEAYRTEIRDSRVVGTQGLVSALTAMRRPPAALLCGSAVHWYGDTGQQAVDESAPNGSGFLAQVVREWEAACLPAAEAGIRVVNLRAGIVLSARGGVIARLLLPFRLGLGARLGTGAQVMSWITLPDYTQMVAFLLAHPAITGPVNMTTPNPVTNAEFTSALADALHRPAMLTVPTPFLKLALGGAASDLLMSIKVMPSQLQGAGYRYLYPQLREALGVALSERAAPRGQAHSPG